MLKRKKADKQQYLFHLLLVVFKLCMPVSSLTAFVVQLSNLLCSAFWGVGAIQYRLFCFCLHEQEYSLSMHLSSLHLSYSTFVLPPPHQLLKEQQGQIQDFGMGGVQPWRSVKEDGEANELMLEALLGESVRGLNPFLMEWGGRCTFKNLGAVSCNLGILQPYLRAY